MQTIIKAQTSADLLALIPALAGFHPRRSLVLVAFRGGRSAGVLRADLPPRTASDEQLGSFAAGLVGTLCRVEGIDGAAVVVYGDGAAAESAAALPHARLAEAVLAQLHQCGVEAVDALGVGESQWWSFLEPGAARHPLDEVLRAAATGPAAGVAIDADQHSGTKLPLIDKNLRARVAKRLRDIGPAVAADPGQGPLSAPLRFLEDIPLSLEHALVTAAPGAQALGFDADMLAQLGWLLARPVFRDVAISLWRDGLDAGNAAFDAQFDPEELSHSGYLFAGRFMGQGPAPDPERLTTALELCRTVAAAVPRHSRAGALAAASWFAWALGRASHADHYARQALRADASITFPRLVLSMLDGKLLPEWAFEPDEGP